MYELNDYEKNLVKIVIRRFHQSVANDKSDTGKTNLVEFQLETLDENPVAQKTRPMNPTIRAAFDKTLQEWLANGIVEPSNSPWASPLVPVRKSGGSWRFAVDFRKVNEKTKPDPYRGGTFSGK